MKQNILEVLWDNWLWVLLAVFISVFFVLYVHPSDILGKSVEFEIVDSCGLLPSNMGVQNTVKDELSCETQCLGKCISRGMDLDYFTFEKQGRGMCNSCFCSCS